jgi:hypothetical protein
MTASIRVRKGCTCKLRWFACQCDVVDDVFTAPAGSEWTIEDTTIPSRAFVDYVAHLHPDADLIYVRLPGVNE